MIISIDDDMFYTCSLIEYIARYLKVYRYDLVNQLRYAGVKNIYDNAQTSHCLSFEQVVDEYVNEYKLTSGNIDNIEIYVKETQYEIPAEVSIGLVYVNIIEHVKPHKKHSKKECLKALISVYNSFLGKEIENFRTMTFMLSREYHIACWDAGKMLEYD